MDINSVDLYNSIKEVPPFSIIEALDKDNAKKVIEKLLTKFKVKDLQDHWKMQKDRYYEKVVYKYGIELKGGRARIEISSDEYTLEQILEMPDNKAKSEVERMRNTYGNDRICNYWGINAYQLKTKVLNKYGIALEKRGRNKTDNKADNNKANSKSKHMTEVQQEVHSLPIFPQYVKPVEEDFEGFKIAFKGTFDGEKLVKRLEGLLLALSDNCKYKINLEIIELESEVKEEVSINSDNTIAEGV